MKEKSTYIGEKITPGFSKEVSTPKNPPCPDFFIWANGTYFIDQILMEWRDLSRKGDRSRNMRTEHLSRAEKVGSWGVGKFHFKVHTTNGRIFEIYYDRTPVNNLDKLGVWVLLCEFH